MLSSITDFKGLVGEVIYAIPTGNNARRCSSVKRFTVISVKRKYVELSVGKYGLTDNFSPATGATQEAINSGYGSNSGYLFFKSESCIKKYNEDLAVRREVQESIKHSTMHLSTDKIKRIHSIIKE